MLSSITSLRLLTLLLGVVPFGFVVQPVQATGSAVAVVCLAEGEDSTSKAFDLVPGKEANFNCTVNNQSEENIDIRLVGRQIHVGSKTAPSLSVADVVLKAAEQQEVSVVFPAVYQSGTYHYSLTLVDLNQRPISPEMLFVGKLEGVSEATIESLSPNKETYQWGDTAELSVTLKTPKEESLSNKYTLRVEMLAANESVCSVVQDAFSVEAVVSKLMFTLPVEDQKCTNDILVTLRDQSGKVVDSKRVAFGLPAMSGNDVMDKASSSFVHWLIWGGVAFLIMLVVGLWFFLRKRPVVG